MKEFNKVIGNEEIKKELIKVIDMMSNKSKYESLGASIPNGLMLYGDPGLGKTLLSTCFIKASKRKAYTIRKNTADGKFVEEIKNTFDLAKKNQPSIILMDDMDKFSYDERYSDSEEFTCVQSCIDEIKGNDVFVIATCNNIKKLPHSLTRPGRFDKIINVKLPNLEDSQKIVSHLLKTKKCDKNVKPLDIARLLYGKSPAALETLINEAAIIAGFENHDLITKDDVIKAYLGDVYGAQEKSNSNNNAYDREIAIHEAGHVVVSELLEPGSVNIVSIKKYNSSTNGFAGFMNDDNYFSDIKFMKNRVLSLLAGKAAVEVTFGKCDVGASSDLTRAYDIVQRFEAAYGETSLNLISLEDFWSEKNRALSEDYVKISITRYYQMVKRILIENRDFLEKIANELMEKKLLFFEDIQNIKSTCNVVTYNII